MEVTKYANTITIYHPINGAYKFEASTIANVGIEKVVPFDNTSDSYKVCVYLDNPESERIAFLGTGEEAKKAFKELINLLGFLEDENNI
jgi:hypothetical protein